MVRSGRSRGPAGGALVAVLLAALATGPAVPAAENDEPGKASPVPGAPPPPPGRRPAGPPGDELPGSYRRVLRSLEGRESAEDDVEDVSFRFGVHEDTAWPELEPKGIRNTSRGRALLLEGDAREYFPGDVIRGALLLAVTADSAVFEFRGERKSVSLGRAELDTSIRVIRQIEGEWAVFFKGERRPLYVGDTYRGMRLVRIEPDAVIVQSGQGVHKLTLEPGKSAFPRIPFSGIIRMGVESLAIVRGRSSPVRAGETIHGALVMEITPHHVVLEFMGETRTVTLR